MEETSNSLMKRLYLLLVVVLVVQAVGAVLAIYYGTVSADRDQAILGHTGTMIDRLIPGLQTDVRDVSRQAGEIKQDLHGLRDQVDRVERGVTQVGKDVNDAGRSVENMNRTVTGFIDNTSGLVWGHSLNPYVLLGLLALILAAVPLFGRPLSAFRRPQAAKVVEPERTEDAIRKKLDELSDLLAGLRPGGQEAAPATEAVERLMKETERLIGEARLELDRIGNSTNTTALKDLPEEGDKNRLH